MNFKRLTLATAWRIDYERGRVETVRSIRGFVGIQARDKGRSDLEVALELIGSDQILFLH